MMFYDRLQLDAAQITTTADGYVVATPRVARTGIQLYYGSELGRTGDDAKKVFRVLRPESSVFDKASMATFGYKPVTDDHPPENVTVDNWKKYSRGQSSGDVARDGEFIRVPMALMDKDLVGKFKDGKKEISMGYETEVSFTSGIDPKYGAYDAIQGPPRINHYAIVDAARGGKDLRFGDGTGMLVDIKVFTQALDAIAAGNVNRDSAPADGGACLATDGKGTSAYPILKDGKVFLSSLRASKTDAVTKGDGDAAAALDNLLTRVEPSTAAVADGITENIQMKLITVDGISVEVANDQAAQIIQKALDSAGVTVKGLQQKVTDTETALAKATKDLGDAVAKNTTELAAKDAEIVTLKKAVEDSKLTPAKLDELVKDRAEVAGKAKTVLGAAAITDGKSVPEIMRQVVDAKLGDKAKGWTDDQVKVSFDTMTADIKPQVGGTQQSNFADMSRAFAGGGNNTAVDTAIAARDKRLQDAYKTPTATA